jgi:uncharacterized protein
VKVEKQHPDLDDPVTGAFWRRLNDGQLAVQRCNNCGYLRWPPGPVCPECLSSTHDWHDLSGRGTVWSLATYHHAFHPSFRDDLPYTVVMVELDEGPVLIGRLVDTDSAEVSVGQRVSATFEDTGVGSTLLHWRPAVAS